ncbi:MAG: copper amine oxidase N-terminal domain-containing protein [Caldisericia bacterium]|nr:copper amine oxidase N-terminal domain-containing protein [Caldisericia bacterium]
MKRLWASCLVFFMVFSLLSLYSGSDLTVNAKEENKQALLAATTFQNIGNDEYGEPFSEEWKRFPWESAPQMELWGREGYRMPNAQLAKDPANPTVNIPATDANGLFTNPVLYGVFYLDVVSNSGKSNLCDAWYYILDDAGQLWLDADGAFNDPRYYAYSDLSDPNYVPGSCASNPKTQVDPIPGNNTQGPYIMDSGYFYNSRDPKPAYRSNIFFWDNRTGGIGTKRFFKLGWADMVDYDANTAVAIDNWDIGLSGVYFRNPNPAIIEFQDELFVNLQTTFCGESTTSGYDFGEFIYLKGTGNVAQEVQPDDIRETYVIVRDDLGKNITYEPGTRVRFGDLDQGLLLNNFPGNTSTLSIDDLIHTDFGTRVGFFDTKEFIYRKKDADGEGLKFEVEVGDIRLTNVNHVRYSDELVNNSLLDLNPTNLNKGPGQQWIGGIWAGDALVLSEVIEGGCKSPTYDLSVETNLWMGVNPSVTSARIRSEFSEIIAHAQDVNKSTSVSVCEDDNKVTMPVTTFHNISLDYREYMGVEIWRDDGINNMFITDIEECSKCVSNDLSDNYKENVSAELYLGAVNGSPDLDYGRSLSSIPRSVLFYDASGNNVYGLGEQAYRKRVDNIMRVVEVGDVRVYDMTYNANGNQIKFAHDSIVRVGDPDLSNALRLFSSDIRYYDEADPFNSNNPANGTLDWFEDLYRIGEGERYTDYDVTIRTLGPRNELLTVDLDNSGDISPDDIRIYSYDFFDGSVVRVGDSDIGVPFPDNPPNVLDPVAMGVTLDGIGNVEYGYADLDASNTVTPGDVRLTTVGDYSPGSVVSPTDTDAGYEDPPGSGTMVYTPLYYRNIDVSENHIVFIRVVISAPPYPIDGEDIPITPFVTYAGIRRISEVTIANVVYEAGTRISAGDVYRRTFQTYMLRMGANGDKHYVDMAAVPGEIGLDVNLSSPLMVERTTEVTVSLDQKLKGDEKVIVYYYDLGNFDTSISFIGRRTITASDPISKLHFTPWRGSLDDSGQYGNRNFKIQAFKVENLPYGTDQYSRFNRPPDGLYQDPFWATQVFRIGGLSLVAQKEMRYPLDLPTPYIPPFPRNYENIYDCYEEYKETVSACEMSILPDKKCLTLYEQRQPSFTVNLYDPDDPLDINDPHSIPIATNFGIDPLFYFNVHGGGIAWLFTTYFDEAGVDKGIVQVNTDNTYYMWAWNDTGYSNMLDSADVITYLGSGGPGRWVDNDCTEGTGQGYGNCGNYDESNRYPPPGDVTYGDTFGGYTIMTYGIPVHISNYEKGKDPGGRGLVIARPTNSSTPVEVTFYSKEAMFDYNAAIIHAPYFIRDFSQGIDYCGSTTLSVIPADPVLNFVDVTMVDHALQYSTVNYTQGSFALSKMEVPPNPFIQARYDPILFDMQEDLRSYPGGQTHTGRVEGSVSSDVGMGDTGRGSGFNAFPAIHSRRSAKKRFTSNYDFDKQWQYDQYNKLGTEFYPLTDYGLFFIMKNFDNEHYSFQRNPNRPDLLIKEIRITGQFATPKRFYDQDESNTFYTLRNNEYNELKNVPIQYNYSGEIIINEQNFGWYEQVLSNFTTTTSPYTIDFTIGFGDTVYYEDYEDLNPVLQFNKRLHYENAAPDALMSGSEPNCFVIDELIPVNRGKIKIEVELGNGIVKTYQDCCEEKAEGFLIHALDLKTDKENFMVDEDQNLTVTLSEYEPKGFDPAYTDFVRECNDAVVVIWQDRGVYNTGTKSYDGAGDGWITRAPRSSLKTEQAIQFDYADDTNEDGKVSFADFETEIVGTYDLNANTWTSGVIDARTFNINNGTYTFNLSEENGSKITSVGWDFGGGEIQGDLSIPDHIIDADEILPVYVTAYKYGDDNNDRAFVYSLANADGSNVPKEIEQYYQYSHEVYLSAQAQLEVKPHNDLIISYGPEPLTAGVTPELADPQSPLTFQVLDSEGEPVDLQFGVADPSGERLVEDIEIWNKLIFDPRPDNDYYYGDDARLPQYYWLRTDLHNNDNSLINNTMLYSSTTNPFVPIETDFREKDSGKYIFKGFCANDEGNFEVYIYTPDRRHFGKAEVNVVLPDVAYKVVNTDDPTGTEYSIPGEPDFILTAGDNRLYKVSAYVKNAQGIPLKGAGSSISICGGNATETSRFTLLSNAPKNYGWAYSQARWYTSPLVQPNNNYSYMAAGAEGGYGGTSYADIHVGIDLNNNGQLDTSNKEIKKLAGFRAYYYNYWATSGTKFRTITGFWTFYNTKNWMWDDGDFITDTMFHIMPEDRTAYIEDRISQYSSLKKGWGLGAIYNSPHEGGYLFNDIDKDFNLTYRDSLNLDKEGKASFYVYAEDICKIGGLVGNNRYSNNDFFADVYGNPGEYSEKSPQRTESRFFNRWQTISISYHYWWCYTYTRKRTYQVTTADNTFRLDWEAMPNRYIEMKQPNVDLYDATTGLALGKQILNTDAYDITYGKVNNILVRAYPADSRDLPLQNGGSIMVDGSEYYPRSVFQNGAYGPQLETSIYGNLYSSDVDPKAKETIISYSPTGTGEEQAFLQYWNKDTRFIYPNFYMVGGLADLDVASGVELKIMSDKTIAVGKAAKIVVYAKVAGTNETMQGTKVSIEGLGIKDSKTADSEGKVEFTVMPDSQGILILKGEMEGLIDGYNIIGVDKEVKKASIELKPVKVLSSNTAIISGNVEAGTKVQINSINAKVNSKGYFSQEVKLEKNINTYEITATDKNGNRTKKIVNVERQDANIKIDILLEDKYIEENEISINGKVTRNSNGTETNRLIWVFVNGIEAKVVADDAATTFDFEAEVPVEVGKNRIEVNVRTNDGFAKKIVDVPNYKRCNVNLKIGSKKATINGESITLDAAPYISDARTFVPLTVIAKGFNATVEWVAQTKGINVKLGDTIISMQIGSNRAIVNNKIVTLDAPPEIKSGRTFVPIRFVVEMLGAEVIWNQKEKSIEIERLSLE